MADAQHMHAAKMAKGETEYQGKLLETRQSDWKDESNFWSYPTDTTLV